MERSRLPRTCGAVLASPACLAVPARHGVMLLAGRHAEDRDASPTPGSATTPETRHPSSPERGHGAPLSPLWGAGRSDRLGSLGVGEIALGLCGHVPYARLPCPCDCQRSWCPTGQDGCAATCDCGGTSQPWGVRNARTARRPHARTSSWVTALVFLSDAEPSPFVQTGSIYACCLSPSLSGAPC
jgi:hypothetical protein